MKKPRAVFFFEKTDFFNNKVYLFGAEPFYVTLKMVTEGALPIITTTGSEIRQNKLRNKIFIEWQAIKIWWR